MRGWSLGWEDPLEEGIATHSSVLAWRIPWTEEPGGLLSIGSQRVGRVWSNLACMHAQVILRGFPGGSDGEEPVCHAGCPGLIPQSRRSPGEGHCNPLQCSCLENPMDRGAWWATVHGVAQSQRRLTNFWISRNSGGASVSQGCRNKVPQTWWLAQQKCIILQFWRVDIQNQVLNRVLLSLKSVERNPSSSFS